MKKMIFLLLAVWSVTATQAQHKVTLAECNGDTVLFLKKAFDERKADFIGQPFSKVVEAWKAQLPVGRLLFSDTGIWPTKDEDKNLIISASLYYNTEDEITSKRLNRRPYYGLGVSFAPPYRHKIRVCWDLQDAEQSALGPQLYEMLKDYIVTKISSFEMQK